MTAPLAAGAAGASDTVSVSVAPAGASYTPFAVVNGWVLISVPPVIVKPVKAPASKLGASRLARNQTLPPPSSSSFAGVGCGTLIGPIPDLTGTTAKGAAPAN
jgi:hypothetical protein